MTRLYVLDFDKTLIPYDSWNLFLHAIFRKKTIRVGFFLVLRKIGLINRLELKRIVSCYVSKHKQMEVFSEAFAQTLSNDIEFPPYLFENKYEKKVVIMSASPMCYLRYLDKYMDCQCEVVGSDFYNGRYIELYGEQKLNYIKTHYPLNQYKYAYALSDSYSDMIWMKEFEKYELKQ